MVRSFDRRIESLFMLEEEILTKQAMNILRFNLKDNVNAYRMQEDGTYSVVEPDGNESFNVHKEFYRVNKEMVRDIQLFS
jgi:polyphosphate kinase